MPQQYSETLQDMVGRLRVFRPNLPPTLARDLINAAIRVITDRRATWAGLMKEAVVTVPALYNTGSITLTQNSSTVTGSGTVWPVSDTVNTTIAGGVTQTGLQTVTPASMTGITVDSLLYVDALGTPEVVSVVATTATSFTADFAQFHNTGCTVTQSSYAGRQLQTSGYKPIYTIKAVLDNTTLLIDQPWGASTLTGQAYTIRQMYFTIAPDIKYLYAVVDPTQGIQLQIHIPVELLNVRDAQRTSVGTPILMADRGPNEAGNMTYEIWPNPVDERNLRCFYFKQWPRLINHGDRLPYFVNPDLLLYYVLGQSFMLKFGENDIYQNPQAAIRYSQMFEQEFQAASIADNEKMQNQFRWNWGSMNFGGANWRQSHAPEEMWSTF